MRGQVLNVTEAELTNKEEELNKLALEVISEYAFQVQPLFPRVLVRVLPKEHWIKRGNLDLIVPDNVNTTTNKPAYEGIVIRTWAPKKVYRKDREFTLVSDYAPGDHVLFPHWAGMPVAGLNENLYRLIPEGLSPQGQTMFGNESGVLLGKLVYDPAYDFETVFKEILEHRAFDTIEDEIDWEVFRTIVADIKDKFEIIPKLKGSMTSSGASKSNID